MKILFLSCHFYCLLFKLHFTAQRPNVLFSVYLSNYAVLERLYKNEYNFNTRSQNKLIIIIMSQDQISPKVQYFRFFRLFTYSIILQFTFSKNTIRRKKRKN